MASTPLPSVEGISPCLPIFPKLMAQHLRKKLRDVELSSRAKGCVTVSEAAFVARMVAELGFFGGVWDKMLTRMYAACTKLRDERLVEDNLSGESFSFWGGAKKPDIAHQAVIEHTIFKAKKNVILQHIVSKRLCSANLLISTTLRKRVKTEMKKDKHLRFQAPNLFWLLKWNSKEE